MAFQRLMGRREMTDFQDKVAGEADQAKARPLATVLAAVPVGWVDAARRRVEPAKVEGLQWVCLAGQAQSAFRVVQFKPPAVVRADRVEGAGAEAMVGLEVLAAEGIKPSRLQTAAWVAKEVQVGTVGRVRAVPAVRHSRSCTASKGLSTMLRTQA